jgi:uncharacterized protein (DUF302 family)
MRIFISAAFIIMAFVSSNNLKAQELVPYIKVGTSKNTIAQEKERVDQALQKIGFKIVGTYKPENNKDFMVIAFSRPDLQNTVVKVKDRGALASVLKVGLKSNGTETTISYLNPNYMFNAYLRDDYSEHAKALDKIALDVKTALSPLGDINEGFGGSLSVDKLRKYHYKMMMPYFSDPVELREFSSFEEGLKIIEKNLNSKKGNTKLIYKIKYKTDEVCVFGIGLMDKNTGEAHFLPIIGDDHVAAMPYEIILQGKIATILHGRYRIALYWPELSMGTFMKIMSTPGDIEDTMEALCQDPSM